MIIGVATLLLFRRRRRSNNIELGAHGRYRTNVWDYPGVNTFRDGRMDDLKMHPTPKPVALVADALLDASHGKDIVLDPFAGSGTTMIAAERVGHRARLIELDPRHVDVCVRRWQQTTGESAVHAESGRTFDEIAETRARDTAADDPRKEVAHG